MRCRLSRLGNRAETSILRGTPRTRRALSSHPLSFETCGRGGRPGQIRSWSAPGSEERAANTRRTILRKRLNSLRRAKTFPAFFLDHDGGKERSGEMTGGIDLPRVTQHAATIASLVIAVGSGAVISSAESSGAGAAARSCRRVLFGAGVKIAAAEGPHSCDWAHQKMARGRRRSGAAAGCDHHQQWAGTKTRAKGAFWSAKNRQTLFCLIPE